MLKIDNAPKYHQTRQGVAKQEEKDIYQFSESVLKELSQDNIPSIPSNYSIYFEKLLDERTSEFKEKLGSALTFYEEGGQKMTESSIFIEKEIKQGFVQIKSMLQAVALIYKNLGLMKGITKKHIATLHSNTDLLAVQNVLSVFNDDLIKLVSLMDKHVEVIRANYEEIGKMFKAIEEQTVYDANYEVYNKKFLINAMEIEVTSSKRYGYHTSFVITKVDEKILFTTNNLKERNDLLKSVAQILLKTSRRSDIVAHYGDGFFIIVMKHTDLDGAKLACARLNKLFSGIKHNVGGAEIVVNLNMVAGELTKEGSSMEEVLSKALDTIASTDAKEPIFLE
ncbi:GGDEF domain-containing protein [Campylobacter gastrosuis]|uniref:Diguanylate cyclase n=1 Tax=Campylobacter gastrosuis TaxID=2974576 RepID=A0ABT7HQ05_9BACT|nr:diguanylate cyclase [Campylobacter gastrosuis]MDL0088802.1 diguanylate cyclase [Campylobacter gastrosuis]